MESLLPGAEAQTKERIGARFHKQSHPQTPYQHVMDFENVTDDAKSKLRTLTKC
jgi:hypothetical protein